MNQLFTSFSFLSEQGKEVEYSLRLLPLGGFVAFPDDDPESPYEGKQMQQHVLRALPDSQSNVGQCSASDGPDLLRN